MSFSPEGFALEIFKKRYAAHDNETWEEACERVANHVSNAESGDDRLRYKAEFERVLLDNLFMPGGRIMYGSGRAKGQLLNCFVIPTEDSREGWGKSVSDSIVISGTGGGVGLNCSPVRPRGLPVAGSGGVATGAVSLMEIINAAGDVIKAGGGRRTALMLCLDVNHGDIEEFLNKKLDLNKLNNANVSVVFNEDPETFFDKVKKDEDFDLVFRSKIVGKVKARELWEKIVQNAIKSGEPGILNGHYANRMSNVYYAVKLTSTNPCITGDTLIAVADGRNAVSIEQLMNEGKDVPVYSTNLETGKVEIKMGRNPRKTGEKKEVWKLTLDDGSVLRATPNHKILLKNLTYVELKDLKPGDSIFPFNSFSSNGYRQICGTGAKMIGSGRRNRRQYRLIHEFHNGETDSGKFAIHHTDFDSLNDRVLKVMTHEEHRALHSLRMTGEANPYHTMSDEWKKKFASHAGESNGRYSGVDNGKLLDEGRKVFKENGKLTQELWIEHAKKNNLPQFLGNEFRFGSFTNFKNQVVENHKVVSVEFDSFEDVYNITVDDNHNYHVVTSTEDDKYVTSSGICVKNCGEIWMSPYDCCCLGALVLPRFVKSGKINWDMLRHAVMTAVRFLDDVLTINNYPLKEIQETCANLRRIGLGVMGLHDMLLMLGHKYNSAEGLELVDKVMNFIKNCSYEASIELAKEKGSFPLFDAEKFLKSNFVKSLKPTIRKMIAEHGIRNCALNTIAPTGTTSMVCGVTSGIEPMFAAAYERRWWNGDVREMEVVVHPLFKRFIEEGQDTSHFQGAFELSVRDHFEMQRVCQKHMDNAVSKTINIDTSKVSASELSDLYMEYIPELKGVTVYPEGSRENQPLTPLSTDQAFQHVMTSSEGASGVDSCRNGACDI